MNEKSLKFSPVGTIFKFTSRTESVNERQSLIIFLDQCKKKEHLLPYHNFLNDMKRSWGC